MEERSMGWKNAIWKIGLVEKKENKGQKEGTLLGYLEHSREISPRQRVPVQTSLR